MAAVFSAVSGLELSMSKEQHRCKFLLYQSFISTPSNELYCFENINYKWFLFLVAIMRGLDFGFCGGVSYYFGIWIEYNISIQF